jgi:hypothetical protein
MAIKTVWPITVRESYVGETRQVNGNKGVAAGCGQIVVETFPFRFIDFQSIQAKRYKGSVGNDAVQEVVGALKFYKAEEGWVITSGRFTQPARALAKANGIHLVDGLDLRKLQQG